MNIYYDLLMTTVYGCYYKETDFFSANPKRWDAIFYNMFYFYVLLKNIYLFLINSLYTSWGFLVSPLICKHYYRSSLLVRVQPKEFVVSSYRSKRGFIQSTILYRLYSAVHPLFIPKLQKHVYKYKLKEYLYRQF